MQDSLINDLEKEIKWLQDNLERANGQLKKAYQLEQERYKEDLELWSFLKREYPQLKDSIPRLKSYIDATENLI